MSRSRVDVNSFQVCLCQLLKFTETIFKSMWHKVLLTEAHSDPNLEGDKMERNCQQEGPPSIVCKIQMEENGLLQHIQFLSRSKPSLKLSW